MTLNDAMDRLMDLAEIELGELEDAALEDPRYEEDVTELKEVLEHAEIIKSITLEKSS